ncbi:MAG: cytochrome P450 [Sandaracinus sp.]|nr:cytochrome P450 [Sandaracinus sp.]MAQ16742.1 cytochrome P450 [Sandaracinus sp.]
MGALATAVRVLGPPRRVPGEPPRLNRELPLVGHMAEFVKNPFALLQRAQREGGELVALRLLHQDVVLATGPEANEAFFRAPDDQLCRREAYKLMTPIFGEGVVFDAPGPRLEEQMRMVMRMLRDQRMRGYPPIICDETRKQVSSWGERGEVDLLELMKDVTMYASSRCLIGDEFRDGMSHAFHEAYDHLEKAIHPVAYIYPHAPLPAFKRRDAARRRLVERVEAIIARRKRTGDRPDDGLQALLDAEYKDGEGLSPHEITGILIAIMMAGHHTSAGTATWTILELIRRPECLAKVRAEVDAAFAAEGELTYQALRQMRYLHDVIKEVLRLHPPLIFLFRKVLKPWTHNGYTVPAGSFLCASPGVSHRIASVFPNPERFDPDRYARGEDADPFAWIAFGGGKHKCTGNAFGLLQLKAVAATLLHEWDFELAQPDDSYRDDYDNATVLPKLPCKVRFRRRATETIEVDAGALDHGRERLLDPKKPVRVTIDPQLCQGHSVCVSEAPKVFRVGERGEAELLPSASFQATYEDSALYERIERAYEHCPNRAISLDQESAAADA